MILVQCIAKCQPRQVNTRYGQKTVINLVGDNGEEISIWRGPNDTSPAVRSITNGSRIVAGLDSKGKYSLVESPADRAAAVAVREEISPKIAPPQPIGFRVDPLVETPIETAARKLAENSPADIEAKIDDFTWIMKECLAAAEKLGLSEMAAIEVFRATIKV